MVNIFGKASDAANAAEEDKSRLYDWLMTTPVVLAGLVDAYDEQGLDSEVATLRQKSADLFVELFAMPHSIFLLTEEGEKQYAIVLLWLLLCGSALADTTGWIESFDKSKNAHVYKQQGNKDNLVKIYPAVLMDAKNPTIDNWLHQKLANSRAPRGDWAEDIKVTRLTANFAIASRKYRTTSGRTGSLEAFAFTADRQYVRLGVVIYKSSASKASLRGAVKLAS